MISLFERRFLYLVLAASLFLFLVPGPASAQVETGRIGGTITDPSGAVIPNAQVTITNVATGAVRNVKSDASGYYVATNLLPGNYSVAVEAPGFVKTTQTVVLRVGGVVNVRIRLAVAGSAVMVEVTGTGPTMVNTETPTVSSSITAQEIQQLPSLTRNPYDFVTISGNVSTDDPSGRGVGVAINGLRAAGTNVQLDGAANNDEFIAAVGQPVPLDSVQEYTVLTNSFGAQYGRADAGVVNVATKSGTNDFHGSAYEYNRVSALASNDFYNNANGIDKGIYTRNQFGFSVGGPIKKDKLFFFVNPEWNRIRSAAPQVFMIPDNAFINASSSYTQDFFNTYGAKRSDLNTLAVYSRQDLINQGSDPCAKSTLGPCLAYPITAPMWDKVTYNTPADAGAGLPTNQLMVDSRVDWNISDKSQMYVRFAQNHDARFDGTVNTSPYAGYETGETISDQNALISFTRTITPSIVSQSKVVYNRLGDLQPLGKAPIGPTLYLANSGGIPVGGYTAILPGYSGTTPGNAIPFGGPQNFYEFYEDISMSHGTHTFRFGGSYTYLIDNRAFGAYEEAVEALSSGGTDALDNFMTGNLYLYKAAVNPQGKFPCVDPSNPTPDCTVTLPVGPPNFTRSNRYNEWGLYSSDEWKVRPRLTLTLGVRWDYFGVQHNKNPNLDSNFYLGSGSNFYEQYHNGTIQIADKSPVGGLWAPDYKDFSPHLGFAWDMFGNGKTSLRGGYSIGYERNFGNVTFNVIQNPPNYAVITLSAPDAGNITNSNVGPLGGTSGSVALPHASFRNLNPNIKTAYAHLYSLTFEQQLASHALVTIGYSGSRGERMYSLSDFNRPGYGNLFLGESMDTNPFAPLNDQYSIGSYRRNSDGVSLYNSMNVGFKLQNFRSTGLTLAANYTYGSAKDDLSSTFSDGNFDWNVGYLDPFNPGLDYGPAEFDNTNRFSMGAVWDIPFARDFHGVAGQVLNGWEVTPIFAVSSGFPFTVFDCTNAYWYCPRAMKMSGTSGFSKNGKEVPVPGAPDTFTWIPYYDSSGNPLFDSSYVNPTVGVSDYGPFPSSMYTRNAFRAPSKYSLDLGIYKNFKVTERYALQFRAEMYDAFNHATSTMVPYVNEVNQAAGVETNRFGHRNIQLALRFTF